MRNVWIRLIQNVPAQVYELVCVDDGSTDAGGGMLDAYAARHANMTVVHQGNRGLSAARNRGMAEARGEYLWFVDADDFIAADCLQSIFPAMRKDKPDLMYVQPVRLLDGTPSDAYHRPNIPTNETSRQYASWLWTCIFRRQVIVDSGVRFHEELLLAEDNLFCSMLSPYIKTRMVYDGVAYIYRQRANSLSTTPTVQKLDKLISASDFFLQSGQSGAMEQQAAMNQVCAFMVSVMAAIAAMPRREARGWLKTLKQKRLFPLKKQKSFAPEISPEGLSWENRILTKLKYQSYMKDGYLRLRAFRFFLKIKRKLWR